jgi:hypothetical protein
MAVHDIPPPSPALQDRRQAAQHGNAAVPGIHMGEAVARHPSYTTRLIDDGPRHLRLRAGHLLKVALHSCTEFPGAHILVAGARADGHKAGVSRIKTQDGLKTPIPVRLPRRFEGVENLDLRFRICFRHEPPSKGSLFGKVLSHRDGGEKDVLRQMRRNRSAPC